MTELEILIKCGAWPTGGPYYKNQNVYVEPFMLFYHKMFIVLQLDIFYRCEGVLLGKC